MHHDDHTERDLAAFYDDRAAAERAQSALLGLGIPASQIRIVLGEGHSSQTAKDDTEPKGFFAMLADLFMPDDDRSIYAEGLNRGGHLLVATVPHGLQDAALDILDNEGAVDMEDRVRQWQGEGWTAPGPGSASTDESMGEPRMAVRQAGILSSGAMATAPGGLTDHDADLANETAGTREDDDIATRRAGDRWRG